jgi:hypothetical protein
MSAESACPFFKQGLIAGEIRSRMALHAGPMLCMSLGIMKPKALFMAALAACALSASINADAPNQGAQGSIPQAKKPDPPEIKFENKWLIVNDRLLHGQLLRDDAGYVFNSFGASMRFGLDEVKAVADTRQGLFKQQRDRIDDKDYMERFQLANWGLRYQMKEEAIAELKSILNDAPDFEPASRQLKLLTQQGNMVIRSEDAGPRSPNINPLDNGRGGFGDDAVRHFTSKVQLILLNNCGTCHANPRYTGAFKLKRGRITPSLTHANFRAAETQCDLSDPSKSKLLQMSITPHGTQKIASFGGPKDKHYQELRKWAYSLAKNWQEGFSDPEPLPEIASNDSHAPARRPGIGSATRPEVASHSKMKPAPDKPGFGAAADDAPPTPPEQMKRPSKAKGNGGVQRPTKDPFDPSEFNKESGSGGTSFTPPATPPRSPTMESSKPKGQDSNGASIPTAGKPGRSGSINGVDPLAPYRQLYGDLPNNWKPASKRPE